MSYRAPRPLLLLVALLAGCSGHNTTVAPLHPPGQTGAQASLSGLGGVVLFKGQVLDVNGLPAAGVAVKVGLLSNNGGSVVAASGSVISDHGGSYRLAQAAATVRTDAQGRFSLQQTMRQDQGAVLEADDEASGFKALRTNLGSTSATVQLQLAPTGSLSGHVKLADQPAVKDLTGIDVFIPGTGYVAKTDASGAYALADVPAGSFTLVAQKDGLGKGSVGGVTVTPHGHAEAPELTMARNVPLVGAVVPPVAAPGTTIQLTGEGFGASTGAHPQVTLDGVVLTQLTVSSDNTLVATLPGTAVSGDLVVSVGGASSSPVHLDVATRVVPLPGRDALLHGETLPLVARALDAAGHVLGDVPVTWNVTGSGASLVDQQLQVGDSGLPTLACSFGSLKAQVSLPVRAEIGLVGVAYQRDNAKLTGLAYDAALQRVSLVDRGSEGETPVVAGLLPGGTIQDLGFTTPGNAVPGGLAVRADGTTFVLADDSSVWQLGAGAPTQVFTPEAAAQALSTLPGQTAVNAPAPADPSDRELVALADGSLAFRYRAAIAVQFAPGGAGKALPLLPPGAPKLDSTLIPRLAGGAGLSAFVPSNKAVGSLVKLPLAGGGEVKLSRDVGLIGGIALDGQGHVYLASTTQHAIYEVAADGTVTTLVGSADGSAPAVGRGGLLAPHALAVDEAGTALWVIDGDRRDTIQHIAIRR